MTPKIPDYKVREGDQVMVHFEEWIHQPGVSKYQSNEFHARTDWTKATTWRRAMIEKVGVEDLKKIFYVRLQKKFKKWEKGWVNYERLQPYVGR